MKVADVLSIPDHSIFQFHEMKRHLIDMAFSLNSGTSIGQVDDPVTSRITARHKFSYAPAFKWPHHTVSLYVLEYLDVPFMIMAAQIDHNHGWSAHHARIHVLDWDVLNKLHFHFTLEEPQFQGFLSVPSDGEIEVGIGCCRVARTSSGYRFVPDDWIEKAAGSVTGRLVFDDDLLRSPAILDSEASIVGAVLPALLADNKVEMNKFRRLYHGYTAAVFENDGRAFAVDLILPQPSADDEGNLKPLNPDNLKYCIRISQWGPASLIETARSFAESGKVPDDDAFVLAVSENLDLSIAQAQAIVAILMTTDVDLFGAFRTWCRNVEPTFLQGKADYDFQSEAIVRKPRLLDLLPSGHYSLDEALEDVEYSQSPTGRVAS